MHSIVSAAIEQVPLAGDIDRRHLITDGKSISRTCLYACTRVTCQALKRLADEMGERRVEIPRRLEYETKKSRSSVRRGLSRGA